MSPTRLIDTITNIYRRLKYTPTVLLLLMVVMLAAGCGPTGEGGLTHIAMQRADGKWVLVDNKGAELKSAVYSTPPTAMSGEVYALPASEGEPVNLFDNDGDKIEVDIVAAGRMEERCIPVVKPGGRLQVLKPSGDVRFELTEIGGSPVMACAAVYRDGLLLVSTADMKTHLVDEDGNVVTDRKPSGTNLQEGTPVRDGVLYGVRDKSGKVVIPIRYAYVQAAPDGWLCTLPDKKGTSLISIAGKNPASTDLAYEQVYYIDGYGYIGINNGWIQILDKDFKPVSKQKYRRASASRQSGRLVSRYIDAQSVARQAYSVLGGKVFEDVKGCLGRTPVQIPAVYDRGTNAYTPYQKSIVRKAPEVKSYKLQAALYFTAPLVKVERTDTLSDIEESEETEVKMERVFNNSSRMYAYGLRLDFDQDNAPAVAEAITNLIKESGSASVDNKNNCTVIRTGNEVILIEVLSTRSLRLMHIDPGNKSILEKILNTSTPHLKRYIPYKRPLR